MATIDGVERRPTYICGDLGELRNGYGLKDREKDSQYQRLKV
jgi:hypothetical protein